MRMSKLLRLGNKHSSLKVALAYSTEEIFLVSPSSLYLHDITSDMYIDFLKGDLSRFDSAYTNALSLHNSRRGIFSKLSPVDCPAFTVDRVSKVLTRDGELILKKTFLIKDENL